jgi:hypothetical protein
MQIASTNVFKIYKVLELGTDYLLIQDCYTLAGHAVRMENKMRTKF